MPVLTLNEVKTHLNITTSTSDAELQTFAAAAEAAIARRIGPLVSTSVSHRVSGARGDLMLPTYPVISLTSVTSTDGTVVSLSDVHMDPVGVLTTTGYGFTSAAYDVVYMAGHAATAAEVPADLRLALLEMTRHLWDSQRRSRGQVNDVPGAAHAFPYRVEELLAPYLGHGVA